MVTDAGWIAALATQADSTCDERIAAEPEQVANHKQAVGERIQLPIAIDIEARLDLLDTRLDRAVRAA